MRKSVLAIGFLFAVNAWGQTMGVTNRPGFDADTNNPLQKSWVSEGNLTPIPAKRLTVKLYKDGLQVASTLSGSDGAFHFDVVANEARYELRIELDEQTEFRGPVSFKSGFPTLVRIDVPQSLYKIGGDRVKAGGSTVSMVNLMAPKKAVQEFQKGRELAEKRKYDEGLEHLKKALKLYAAYPDAYNQIGLIQRQLAHLPEAEEMYRKAIDTDPKWLEPYVNLAGLQMARSDFAEMFKTTAKALELDASHASLHFFQAVGFFNAQNLDGAEKEALLAEQNEKGRSIPEVQMLLANVYEARGKKADALARYRLFLKQAPESSSAVKVAAHVAALERELEHSQKLAKAGNP
jgi:tetratricopeptide (TPR) repeat protein